MTSGHALVTGASSDLGHAIARAIAADGWTLTLTGRDEARLAALSSELGKGCRHIAGDLADPAFRQALSAATTTCTGFVHAASHRFEYQRFHRIDPTDAAKQQAIDHDAPIDLLTRALPEMMARRTGRVVIVSSLAAQVGGQGATLYAAHKAGLEGLVRGLAVEYGRFGITVNAVAPGFIATSRFDARTSPEARARLIAATTLKRLADPAEVAAAVAFLMNPKAAYITGITLPVTGGLHLNNAW